MKTKINTTAFLAVILAVIFSIALVLPQVNNDAAVGEATVSSAVEELSSEEALGAIILVRQVRVSKKDLEKEEETQQLVQVDHILSRYE